MPYFLDNVRGTEKISLFRALAEECGGDSCSGDERRLNDMALHRGKLSHRGDAASDSGDSHRSWNPWSFLRVQLWPSADCVLGLGLSRYALGRSLHLCA